MLLTPLYKYSDREKIYRRKAVDELLETERSYVETLTVIVDVFLKPLFDETKIKYDRKPRPFFKVYSSLPD